MVRNTALTVREFVKMVHRHLRRNPGAKPCLRVRIGWKNTYHPRRLTRWSAKCTELKVSGQCRTGS